MTEVSEEAASVSESLRKLIIKVAKEHEFDNYDLVIKSLNSGGGNYMGDLYSIDIQEQGKETLHLFAKASNAPEKTRVHIPARTIYEREIFTYAVLAGIFDDLQTKHGIPEENRFKFAKYYGSDLTELEEVLILENLAKAGYVMYDRRKNMNWEYAKASVDQLAKFHALSYALEIEDPEKFDELIRSKKDILANRDTDDEMRNIFRDRMMNMAIEVLPCEYHEAIRKFGIGIDDFWRKQLQPLTKQSVLAHGDYRISNQMVKYEEGVLTSLVPLDYQTIFHGSPINDLLYLLFTGTDSDFRREHYDAYIQHYRDSLARALAAFSLDIEVVYPRALFLQHLRDKLLYGVMIGIFYLPLFLTTPGERIDIEDLMSEDTAPVANKHCLQRLQGILDDMVRWGALQL